MCASSRITLHSKESSIGKTTSKKFSKSKAQFPTIKEFKRISQRLLNKRIEKTINNIKHKRYPILPEKVPANMVKIDSQPLILQN